MNVDPCCCDWSKHLPWSWSHLIKNHPRYYEPTCWQSNCVAPQRAVGFGVVLTSTVPWCCTSNRGNQEADKVGDLFECVLKSMKKNIKNLTSRHCILYISREFKIYNGDGRRKRHLKIYLSFIISLSRLFSLFHVLQCGRSILKINWYERFQS